MISESIANDIYDIYTSHLEVNEKCTHVEELVDDDHIKRGVRSEYMVQFLVSSDDVEEVIPTPLKI